MVCVRVCVRVCRCTNYILLNIYDIIYIHIKAYTILIYRPCICEKKCVCPAY